MKQKIFQNLLFNDLSKPDSFPNLINECGAIDILINNASIFSKDKLIESNPAKVFKNLR